MAGSRGVLGRSKQVFIQFWLGAPTQIATDIGSEMALDNRPLTALGASEQQASLAALPEDLWRKIASLARPPTVRALVVACSDASLRSALRTDIDRAERARNPHPVRRLRDRRERPGALELPGHRPTRRPFRNPPSHDPTPSPRPVASTQDGFLVGGASLKPEICEIVKEIAVAKNTFAMGGA